LTGILLPVLMYDLLFGIGKSASRNLWIVIACYVISHSFSDHKEFRFLLPILPMICLLCGTRMQDLMNGVRPFRRKQMAYIGAVPNIVAVLYLGLIYQRAPIEVNRAILGAVSATRAPIPDTIQVHYLMGCHSTPLSSHLHNPTTKVVPWYLDCSPECRKNPEVECESDSFSKDPEKFMKQIYFECNHENDNEDHTCSSSLVATGERDIPDYIVCNVNDLQKMMPGLSLMGMKEIGRFTNGINGILFSDTNMLQQDYSPGSHGVKLWPFQYYLSLSYEEIVLLQRL